MRIVSDGKPATPVTIEPGQVYLGRAFYACASSDYRETIRVSSIGRCQVYVEGLNEDGAVVERYEVGVADFVASIEHGLLVHSGTVK